MPQSFKEIVESIKGFYTSIRQKYAIKAVYLFGSWAYGNPKEDSDIDIALIMEDNVSSDIESNIYSDAQDINTRFETHIFSAESFKKERRQIIHEIKNKGIKIV